MQPIALSLPQYYRLREFTLADLPAYQAFRNPADFGRAYYPADQLSPEFSQILLNRFVAAQAENPRKVFQLAIADASDCVVGSVGIRFEADTDAKTVANLGFELLPAHRGTAWYTAALWRCSRKL